LDAFGMKTSTSVKEEKPYFFKDEPLTIAPGGEAMISKMKIIPDAVIHI
jgi:hypothetical protein